jgi:hypothetical protein
MSTDSNVYDLGEMGEGPKAAPSRRQAAPGAPTVVRRVPPRAPARRGAVPRRFPIFGSLSVIVPGAGQFALGDPTAGLFFLTSMAFLASLGWALIGTLERIAETLMVLGYPRQAGVWALGLLYIVGAVVHLGSVWQAAGCDRVPGERPSPPPVLAGAASMLVPGWGQLLNGNRLRAVLFLGALWVIGAAWLVTSAPVVSMLDSVGLVPGPELKVFGAPMVRWTLPAVVWAVAVYDAFASATSRRREAY